MPCRRHDVHFLLPILRATVVEDARGWRASAKAVGTQCVHEMGEHIFRSVVKPYSVWS